MSPCVTRHGHFSMLLTPRPLTAFITIFDGRKDASLLNFALLQPYLLSQEEPIFLPGKDNQLTP